MTPYAVALIVASALIHVAWNTAGKRESPAASFLLLANTFGAICLLPTLVWISGGWPDLPSAVWQTLAVTGLCQALYYAGLAGAYRSGELSVVYPLARSVPPVLVVVGSTLIGRSEQVSDQCVLGIALILAGSVLLPLRSFAALDPRSYLSRSSALALLAAAGTAGYSLLDDHGLRLLRDTAGGAFSAEQAALVYAPLEALSASLWLSLWVAFGPGERAALRGVMGKRKLSAALTGVGIYGSYVLALVAMAFVPDVSYVVGLRQLSVPLGALVGIRLLGEAPSRPKLVGVVLASLGLLAVATG